jgi:hypothetical protein
LGKRRNDGFLPNHWLRIWLNRETEIKLRALVRENVRPVIYKSCNEVRLKGKGNTNSVFRVSGAKRISAQENSRKLSSKLRLSLIVTGLL